MKISPKKILFPILLVIVSLLMTLLMLEIVCRCLPVCDSLMVADLNEASPIRKFEAKGEVTFSLGPLFKVITKKRMNNAGFLNDFDYKACHDEKMLAVVGDSYVEACQVSNQNAFHGLLAEKVKGIGRVYSFGSSGSQLSTYLSYAEHAVNEYGASSLVIVIVSNDFDESLQTYKFAPGFYYFTENENKLELIRRDYQASFMKSLARNSAFARYLFLNLKLSWQLFESIGTNDKDYVGNTLANADIVKISDSEKAVNRFFELLPSKTGLKPREILFVVDGMRQSIYNSELRQIAKNSYFSHMRQYFIKQCNTLDYEVLDMHEIFSRDYEKTGQRYEFENDNHWNEKGHSLVAESISKSKVFQNLFNE